MIKPSDYNIDGLLELARNNRQLGLNTSLVQVEYGLETLGEFWAAYSDFCDRHGETFETEEELAEDFAKEAEDHMEFLSTFDTVL